MGCTISLDALQKYLSSCSESYLKWKYPEERKRSVLPRWYSIDNISDQALNVNQSLTIPNNNGFWDNTGLPQVKYVPNVPVALFESMVPDAKFNYGYMPPYDNDDSGSSMFVTEFKATEFNAAGFNTTEFRPTVGDTISIYSYADNLV
jgi:hypothetical protein